MALKPAPTTEKIVVSSTHRGHLRRIGGGRRRLLGTVHDGLESLTTIDGILSQWIYNEIIGFIGLYFDGHQVLGKYFEVTAKRIVRTRRKIFEYKTHKLAAEISMPFQPGEPFDPTNEELFGVVQQYVERCREALLNRWIEDAQLLKLGPFLDWKRLLAASQSGHAD